MPLPTTLFSDLPAMPFGQASATLFTSEHSCGEFLARLPDAPSRFGAIGRADGFRIGVKSVLLPGVTLVAGSSTPKATDHCSRRLALVIPFGGVETWLRTGGEEHHWAAPHHAFFIPAGERIDAESTGGAFLRLDIVETDLVKTAAGMGPRCDVKPAAVDLSRSRIVPLRTGGVNWLPVIRSLCGTIDALDCDAKRLVAAGFDDVILRTAALMLHPELLVAPDRETRQARKFDLDPLLERITSNLAGRITLTEMEAWSGRGARAIQLAFRKRFGIAPLRWVLEQRLDLFRARLLAARPGDTVRGIAASCGLTRMATLVPEYTARFGERPGDTLRGSAR